MQWCSVVPPLCPGTWPGNTAGIITSPCQVPGGMEPRIDSKNWIFFFLVSEMLSGKEGEGVRCDPSFLKRQTDPIRSNYIGACTVPQVHLTSP